MPIGLDRNKTRSQAQQLLTWVQERFDGGLDLDLPGTKVATNEFPVLENIISYKDYLEGGTGRRIYTTTPLPGAGTFRGWIQNPISKRVLLYREDQLWLSSDASMTSWQECVSPGPNGGDAETGDVTIGTTDVHITFTLRGLNASNTNGYQLYFTVFVSAGTASFSLYKDVGLSQLVATGGIEEVQTVCPLTEANSSGISGSASWNGYSTLTDGTWVADAPLQFSASFQFGFVLINEGDPKMDTIERNFIIFVRNESDSLPRTVFVDESQLQYWMLSTKEGYGQQPLFTTQEPSTYVYRYLYTFSRIVDPATGNPAPGLNRVTGSIEFEGPSNQIGSQPFDYVTYNNSAPVLDGNPNLIQLIDPSGNPIGNKAANYITHISIYRTMDIGVSGIDPNVGVGNNSEIYVWLADTSISSIVYSDEITDDTLRYRLQTGSFNLQTRFFTEMGKGVGAVGPDFMFTATQDSQRVDYCPLADPRFIGYFNATLQYFNCKDVVEQILRTRTQFVIMCRYLTMISTSQIYQDAGTLEFLPVIQDFNPASDSIGVTSFHSYCRLDDSTFAALCSDGTIRIFASGRWGDPLDANKIHREVIIAQPGASLGFVRGAFYFFYTTTSGNQVLDKCMRYGFGGLSGFQWSSVARPNWIHPPIGLNCLLIENINEIRQLIEIDGASGAVFSFEDPQGISQIVDDTVTSDAMFVGTVADRFSHFQVQNYSGNELFGYFAGGDNATWFLYLTAADRDNFTNAVLKGDLGSTPGNYSLIAQSGSGMLGSVEFDGNLAGPDGNLDVTFTGAGISDIPCRWRPKELIGQAINFTCFHEESHLSVLPSADVMPEGFAISLQGYANGAAVPGAYVPEIAYGGAISYQSNLEGVRIQNEFTTTTSGFRIASMNTQFQSHDMKSTTGPQSTSESAYQRELAGPFSLWMSRYSSIINRADGVNLICLPVIPEFVSDPVGQTSAMKLFTDDLVPITMTETRPVSVRAFMWWMSAWAISADPTVCLFRILTGSVVGFYIKFDADGNLNVNGTVYDISAFPQGTWYNFAVVIEDTTTKIYINGILLYTTVIAGASITGDNLIIGPDAMGAGNTGFIIYDPRWFIGIPSVGAINYDIRDITLNNGLKVLP